MLTLTLALGVWQVQRLAWKTALLKEIDRGEAAAAIPLASNPAPFSRVFLQGRFLSPVARYGAEVRPSRGAPAMGAHLISPMERADGVPVMVDRGWAPLDFDPTPPAGQVRIEGYIRPPERPIRFGAVDDPVGRRFFALDPGAIGAALGLAAVAPYTLVAMGPPGGLPAAATALPRPPNNHLVYALTWFGLSAALVAVFIVYARQTLRQEHAT